MSRPSIKKVAESWVIDLEAFSFEESYTPLELARLYNTKVLSIEQPADVGSAQEVLDRLAQSGCLFRTFDLTTGDTRYTRNPCITLACVANERDLPSELNDEDEGTEEQPCFLCGRAAKGKGTAFCTGCGRLCHKACLSAPQRKGSSTLCDSCAALPERKRWAPRPGVVGLLACAESGCANAVIQALVATAPTIVKTVLAPYGARAPLVRTLRTVFSYMCSPEGDRASERKAEACRELNGYIHNEKKLGTHAFDDSRKLLGELVEQLYSSVDPARALFEGQTIRYFACPEGHETSKTDSFKVCHDVPEYLSEGGTDVFTAINNIPIAEREAIQWCTECGKKTRMRLKEQIIKAPKVFALCFQTPCTIPDAKALKSQKLLAPVFQYAINKGSTYSLTALIVNTHTTHNTQHTHQQTTLLVIEHEKRYWGSLSQHP